MAENHVNAVTRRWEIPWKAAYEDALTGFILEGMSMRDIAWAINLKFQTDYSRNAVCGKAFRLGLKAIEKAKVIRKPREKQPYKPRPKRPPPLNIEALQMQCSEIIPRNLKLVDLKESDCRWPYGSGPYVHCGHRKIEGSSYCPNHYALSISNGTASERRASQMVNA
jgi:GcrA cell cycle regulator